MNRGAFKQIFGERPGCYLIKYGALLMLEPQVVVELPRIFKRIDLRLAVRAKRNADARSHDAIGGKYAISEISLGGWTGTYCRFCSCKHVDFRGRDMDCMHRRKVRPEDLLPVEKLYRRESVFTNARCVLGYLFRNMHVKRNAGSAAPGGNLSKISKRHSAGAMRRNSNPDSGGIRVLARERARVFEKG